LQKQIAKLIGNNEKTIYRWKKENRQIINLLEKYFTKQDLEQFLDKEKIDRYDNLCKTKKNTEKEALEDAFKWIETQKINDLLLDRISEISKKYNMSKTEYINFLLLQDIKKETHQTQGA